MTNIILNINEAHLNPLAKLKIENLVEEAKSGSLVHPPHVIEIRNYEPLRLAKKKHYTPYQSALKIQKRTGSKKPQGRPFNSNLNARFLLFNNVNDLTLNLLNTKALQVGFLQAGHITLLAANNIHDFKQFELEERMKIEKLGFDSGHQHSFQLKSISFEKISDISNFQIYNELCKVFGVDELSFVKTIRNHKGKLIKFEIMSSIETKELNIDFIKKFITYPRYKSKMKIFIINKKFDQNVWFYNDLRMLLWDMSNLKIENTKIMINRGILD